MDDPRNVYDDVAHVDSAVRSPRDQCTGAYGCAGHRVSLHLVDTGYSRQNSASRSPHIRMSRRSVPNITVEAICIALARKPVTLTRNLTKWLDGKTQGMGPCLRIRTSTRRSYCTSAARNPSDLAHTPAPTYPQTPATAHASAQLSSPMRPRTAHL